MHRNSSDMVPSYGLTPLQQTMYASASLTQRVWQYVEQIVVHMPSGDLDVLAMGRAWSQLAVAHPALRNIINTAASGAPTQRPVSSVQVVPVVYDGREAVAEDFVAEFLAEDRAKGVEATVPPAFRIAILRIAPAQSVLVWTFPHSLLDGRCFAPLLDEVFQRYDRIRSGDVTPVAEVLPQNVFETHCRTLADMSHEAGEAHFADTLAGWEGSEGLRHPDAKPVRKVETTLHLTVPQTKAVAALAGRAKVKPSTVVLAAWGIVLARVSGQGDVVFGNTRNGRHLVAGAADAAGCFITTVPVRVTLDRALTLGGLLKQLHTEQIAVRPFEHTPLTRVRRRLGIPQGRQIFDTVVMFDQATLDAQLKTRNPDWMQRKVELFEEGDMPVSVAAYMGDRLQITVEYDPALVPQGAGLAGHMRQLLVAMGHAQPDTLLGAISMLDGAAVARLTELAGPHAPVGADAATVIDRFEMTARRQPDEMAVIGPDGTGMTYGALDTAADILAGNLVASGVKPGDVIGICMARSVGFITAMLAIWKAGAAFVPMDPGYPSETLDIIAVDSGARLILTDDTAPQLDAQTRGIADLETGPVVVRHVQGQGRRVDDLAYVIFTSGSTGRPKGVMVTHGSLGAHASAVIGHYELQPQDRVLQFAALSFDVALEEIVPTLVTGATLVLRSDAATQSVTAFLDHTHALGITVVNLPTGFWVALTEVLDRFDHDFPKAIRLVIVGGERVPLAALKRWRALLPDLRWINGYGPTEATITCTTFDAVALDPTADSVPIGVPLPHARAWVLSRDGALVPEGVEGELFISGPAVAQGYINNPDQTAQSFVRAVYDAKVGRIYATGDRVMWRGGMLHYLGRVDRQIKLRGFRIEPGQIEDALLMQDGVGRAYADLVSAPSGPPQLVAWYSAHSGAQAPAPDAVRALLRTSLPPQMQPVPVAVTEWPHTPGGKLDVARLPRPDAPARREERIVDAGNPQVQQVTDIFTQILQNDDVGPATSFFDAGGDSLSLLRLMPELERSFDVRLEPTALYHDPTPQGVVRALQDRNPDPLVVIPIQTNGHLAPLYAVHVLGDNGSFFRPLSDVLGNTQPVYGLTVGLLTEKTPTTVPQIAQFYLRQIERHYPQGPLSLIAVSAGSYVTLELAQLLLKSGRDVSALILLDAEGPGGRARIGPMARIGVHMSAFLRRGWPYLAGHLAARREARMQRAAHARLQSNDSAVGDGAGMDIGGVADFVAANMIAIDAYDPKPYARPLTIFRAADDRFDSKRALETGLGWSQIAAGGFDLTDVPGDHLGILSVPNVKTLGARIKTLLRMRRKK